MTSEKIPSKYFTSLFLPVIIITMGAYFNGIILFGGLLELINNLVEFFLLTFGSNFLLILVSIFSLFTYFSSRKDLYKDSNVYKKSFYYLELIIALTSLILLGFIDVMFILNGLLNIEWHLYIIIHYITAMALVNVSFIVFSYYCIHNYYLIQEKIKRKILYEKLKQT